MDPAGQVILVLKVLLHVGPVAAYFITLGLVNSQSSPKMVDARTDFLALTFVFCPLLYWPVPGLVQSGLWWVVLLGLAVLLPVFQSFLSRVGEGWVVYNISDRRAIRLLDRAARELGRSCSWDDRTLRLDDGRVSLRLSALPVLRNVTVHVQTNDDEGRRVAAAFRERFSALLSTHQLLPSVTGSCLLLLGVGLMMLPLWMMSRHSAAIAEVVNRWLLS
jgi:hypothetical protein